MTRTSELFSYRRPRTDGDSEPWFEHSPTASNRYGRSISRRRTGHGDLDSFDYQLWRSYLQPSSVHSVPEISPSHQAGVGRARMDQMNGDEIHRLPEPVLLARARLLERLRGMSLAESRSSLSTDREFILSNETIIRDVMDRRFDNSVWQFTQPSRLHLKPPGLTSSEIDLLPSELFTSITDTTKPSSASDCSICLETFSIGDRITHLPCRHSYHFKCLQPWIKACGDCPNCRREIVLPTTNETQI